jgi:hypothetical protein
LRWMFRHTALFLSTVAFAAACPPAMADEGALLAIPGKIVYENPLAATPAAPWRAAKGKWEAVEGVLRGSEVAEDKHGGVLRMIGPVADNVIIQYEFRFTEGARVTTFSINGVKDHICRVIMSPTSFAVQKDDSDHAGPDKAVIFSRQKANLKPGTDWHSVRIEIIGKTMLGKCDDLVAWGENDLIGAQKTNMGFTVSGQSVEIRNLKVLEGTLNPQWETVKASLPAGTPAKASGPAKKGAGKGKSKADAKGKNADSAK